MGNYKNRYNLNQIIFSCLLFLFPILPQYVYVVGGINVVNFTLLVFIIAYIAMGSLRIWKIPTPMIFFFGYLVYYTCRFVADAAYLEAITHTLAFIIIPYLVVGYIDSKKCFFSAIDVLIFGGVVLGVLGIIESVARENFIQWFANSNIEFFHDVRYGLLRIMTTFGQPIGYGLYQVFISALIYYRLNTDITSAKKRYLTVALILSVANVFLSVSRIPMIALIMFWILALYKKSKKKFANTMILAFFICLAGIIVCNSAGIKIPLIDDLILSIQQMFGGQVSESAGTEGIGNRLDLWLWVAVSMGGAWWFGKGPTTAFAYQVYGWQTKTSIENRYLQVLYNVGLVGVFALILSYISTIYYAKKGNKRYGCALQERSFSFNDMISALFLVYYIVSFGVQETDMSRTYVIFIALLIAYNRVAKTLSEGART